MNVQLSDLAEHKSGSLIVGTSPYRSAGMMPQIVKQFRKKYPQMHIVVEEHVNSELIDGLSKGEFDLCLMVMPVDTCVFDYERVAQEELLLAVPADAPKFEAVAMQGRKYDAIDIRCIDRCEFVTITETQVMQCLFDNLCIEYGLHTTRAAVVKSLEAQIAMVRAGVGMAVVPSGIERFCSGDEVRFYSFVQDLPCREVVAVWRKDRRLSAAALDLVATMRSQQNDRI
jgi:DNA-binding transcriptional LysR family regulator